MATSKPARIEPRGTGPMVPWEPTFGFPLFNRLSRELDAMFGRFGFERPMFETLPSTWSPTLEMFTKENSLCVKVDVPGMKKEEVTVEVTPEHLVVRGERKNEVEESKEGFFRTERTYGSFYRAVPLPEHVNTELAKASLHDGVLEITMPMTKVVEQTRKLEIAEPEPAKAVKAA